MEQQQTSRPKDRLFYSLPTDDRASNIVTYLDFIASGRGLSFIEDYIRKEVLPDYGNTHTTTSITSLQTTLYRHEARDIIRNSVHASEHDSVIFCGSGCTAAVHKLIHALQLPKPPVVFVGPYEHHSNLLPWKELGSKVIRIKATVEGVPDVEDLKKKLQKWKVLNRQMIGCFSAASNITGILVNTDEITVCLHKHGALAFWDYATAAPYVKIDINPVTANSEDQPYIYKDAVFISPHKLLEESQHQVRREGHRYLQEPELKEESGTPAIVESIRAGLVFQLKDAVTSDTIMEREHQLFRKAKEAWKDVPNLVLLGNLEVPRLPVFSFLIYHPHSGRFLHHNYVAAILNDLFGIQARGGCACAGPYAMDMLGLDEKTATQIENLLMEDERLDRTHLRRYREYSHREIIRPGFVRINLPFFMDDDKLEYVLDAIKLVAEHGWKLLPQVFKDRKWLGHITYTSGEMKYKVPPPVVKGPLPDSDQTRHQLPDHTQMFDDLSQQYRWFMLPSEAASCLHGDSIPDFSSKLPFCPPHFREQIGLPPFKNFEDDDGNPLIHMQEESSIGSNIIDASDEQLEENKSKSETFSKGMINILDKGYNEVNAMNDTICAKKNEENEMDFVVDLEVNSGVENNTSSVSIDKDTKLIVLQTGNSIQSTNDSSSCKIIDKMENKLTEKGNYNEKIHDKAAICDDGSELTNSCRTNKKRKFDDSSPKCSLNVNSTCALTKTKNDETKDTCVLSKTKTKERLDTGPVNKVCKWFSPPKQIFKPFVSAIEEHLMVRDGDKILGIKFEFGAVTVDPQTPSYDPSPLKEYLASIMESAMNLDYECASICSFCSRMKRGRIYACARREGYNVLALGQHLDDLCESFLMSLFHNGILRTMKAQYTERHRTKQLLAAQEIMFPRLFNSMMSAIKPIMAINKTHVSVAEILREGSKQTTDDDDMDL
ncbi:hypothetical protein KUTeg_024231 [Tegillarca granosa]|uniref:Aminotransferase class V domain-containing protein n=1 Tax=Tegillarca granosa TaxID=220873 RepID=A0ABQ9E2I4_TEGGR|nr:hypothetical protein KUTeg_024231 [Tegillarca granosa]